MARKQGTLTIGDARDYFLSQPLVSEDKTDQSMICLKIGKEGQGVIEILNLDKKGFVVTIYYELLESRYDHIHEAIEWCLGPDAYGAYRQLFNLELGVLTTIPSTREDLQKLYALAITYLGILDDAACLEIESQMEKLREKLRSCVKTHISAL